MSAIAGAVRAAGYWLWAGAIEADLVARLRRDLEAAQEREEERFGADILESVGQRGYVSDFLGIGASAGELLAHPSLQRLVDELFDGDARLYVAQGILAPPGSGRGVWPRRWHADMFDVRSAIPDGRYTFGVTVLVSIDEAHAGNGSTCVVPGSHELCGPVDPDPETLERLSVTITAPPGSLLVMDGGLWHSAGINRSQDARRLLKLVLTRAWIQPQVDYRAASQPAVLDALPAAAAGLLAGTGGG